MRLSLGCFGACWVAGLLPVFSGVLVSKSLIINGVSFSGNVAVLLVALGSSTSSGHSGWYWRNAFLSPSNRVSRFSVSFATELWLLKGSLPYPSLKAMATKRYVGCLVLVFIVTGLLAEGPTGGDIYRT